MIKFLQGVFVATLTIAFLALCVYAWHTKPPVHMSQETRFFLAKQAAYHPKDAGVTYRGRERTVLVWKDKKAAMLAEALSLTPESIDATVDLRRLP